MEARMQAGKGHCHHAVRGQQRGFTYITVMAVVALLGLGLAAIGPRWAEQVQREREQELLRVGGLYAEAIANYYLSSPGSLKRYPPNLESLLLDTRFVGVQRHIRRLYADPLRPGRAWGVLRAADGGVMGVYAQDERAPLLKAPRLVGRVQLPAAQRYSDWKFMPEVKL
jgi:type II secretory pathway pseudopilin PulG